MRFHRYGVGGDRGGVPRGRLQHARLLRAIGGRPSGDDQRRASGERLAERHVDARRAARAPCSDAAHSRLRRARIETARQPELPTLRRSRPASRGVECRGGARAEPGVEDLVLPGGRLRRVPRLLRPRRCRSARGRAARRGAGGRRLRRASLFDAWLAATGSAATRCCRPSSATPKASWRGSSSTSLRTRSPMRATTPCSTSRSRLRSSGSAASAGWRRRPTTLRVRRTSATSAAARLPRARPKNTRASSKRCTRATRATTPSVPARRRSWRACAPSMPH